MCLDPAMAPTPCRDPLEAAATDPQADRPQWASTGGAMTTPTPTGDGVGVAVGKQEPAAEKQGEIGEGEDPEMGPQSPEEAGSPGVEVRGGTHDHAIPAKLVYGLLPVAL